MKFEKVIRWWQFSLGEECTLDSITKFCFKVTIEAMQEDVFLLGWVG